MTSPAPALSLAGPADRSGRLYRPVLLMLVLVAAAAIAMTGFVAMAPNRLVSGRPAALWAASTGFSGWGIAALLLLLLAAALSPQQRWLDWAAAVLSTVLLVLVLVAAGRAAASLTAGAPAMARVSLGPGFWLLFAASALGLIDALQRTMAGIAVRLLWAAAMVLVFVLLATAGSFDALSLTREYQTRQGGFNAAVIRHVVLVAAAIGPALLIGLPLGIAATRRPPLRGPLFAVLNLLQTVPSIALFGLLIVPLSSLAAAFPPLAAAGIAGIGLAPAVIALVLYALLPIVRSTAAGLGGVDPAIAEAGRGMGMTRRQLFWRVEVPLALPVLFAGLRIVTVQSIGLAVVAALIGAGGLGAFVFEGLGQYAADLILLGAIPAILLALTADFLLQSLGAMLRRRLAP